METLNNNFKTIIEEYSKPGASLRSVAAKFGISYERVRQILCRHNITRKRRRDFVDNNKIQRAIYMYKNSNMSLYEIVKLLGYSSCLYKYISEILKLKRIKKRNEKFDALAMYIFKQCYRYKFMSSSTAHLLGMHQLYVQKLRCKLNMRVSCDLFRHNYKLYKEIKEKFIKLSAMYDPVEVRLKLCQQYPKHIVDNVLLALEYKSGGTVYRNIIFKEMISGYHRKL